MTSGSPSRWTRCDYKQGAIDTYNYIKPILEYAYNGR